MTNIKNWIKELLYASILIPFILYSAYMMGEMNNKYKQLMMGLIIIFVLLTYLLSFALRNLKINYSEEDFYKKFKSLIFKILESTLLISFILTLVTIFYFSPYLISYFPLNIGFNNIIPIYISVEMFIELILIVSIIICFIALINDDIFNINHILLIQLEYLEEYGSSPKVFSRLLNKGYFYRYSTPE